MCPSLLERPSTKCKKRFLSPLSPKTLNAEAILQSVHDRHLELVSACSKRDVPHAE